MRRLSNAGVLTEGTTQRHAPDAKEGPRRGHRGQLRMRGPATRRLRTSPRIARSTAHACPQRRGGCALYREYRGQLRMRAPTTRRLRTLPRLALTSPTAAAIHPGQRGAKKSDSPSATSNGPPCCSRTWCAHRPKRRAAKQSRAPVHSSRASQRWPTTTQPNSAPRMRRPNLGG
jgi:hypothetical protein